jgi:hypothetical protein
VKDELIYDFSENRIIIAHTINVLLLTNSGYLAFERNNVEITMIVSSDNFMWASDWFSIQYDKQGYSNTYKKKIHADSLVAVRPPVRFTGYALAYRLSRSHRHAPYGYTEPY